MRTAKHLIVALGLLASRASAAPKIALCVADGTGTPSTVKSALLNTGAFSGIDVIDTLGSTPTMATIDQYDAVLIFGLGAPSDRTALGNILADYADGGGGVVQAGNNLATASALAGRWSTDGYSCIQPSNTTSSGMLKPQPNEPQSPLVAGVTSLTAISYSVGSLAAGATSVWDYQNGSSAIARCGPKGLLRAEANLYPNTANAYVIGDYLPILKNALLFVSGKFHPLQGAPNPATLATTSVGATSAPTTITFTNGGATTQQVTALDLRGTNAADYRIVSPPTLPFTVGAGGNFTVQVDFSPGGLGARPAFVRAKTSGELGFSSVALAGSGVAAKLSTTPSPLWFGATQQTGTQLPLTVTVTNVSGGAIVVSGASVSIGGGEFQITSAPQFPQTLQPNGSFQLGMTFTAQQVGQRSGRLTLTTNDGSSPTVVFALSGSAGPAAIALPSTLSFGTVNIGAKKTSTATITNSGYSDLQVTGAQLGGANPGDFTVDQSGLPWTLGPGKSRDVSIDFVPTGQPGSRTASLAIASNDPSTPSANLPLEGTATSASLGVSPMMLDFGAQRVGQQSMTQDLTLTNSGNGTLHVTGLTLGGADASSFGQTHAVPFDIPSSSNATVEVFCHATRVGMLAGTLTIATDIGDQQVSLACFGKTASVSIMPSSLDFGDVILGSQSALQKVTVSNTGSSDLHISSFSIGGADRSSFISQDPLLPPLTLAPSQSVSFHVFYAPGKSGLEHGEVDIGTDDPQMQLAKVLMSGTGTLAAVTPDPLILDFGQVLVGGTGGPQTLTLANSGQQSITIDEVLIGGSSAPPFALDSPGPWPIGVGQTTSLQVSFLPIAVGTAQAVLTGFSAGQPEFTVGLRGVGLAADIAANPDSLAFIASAIGARTQPLSVVLHNRTPVTVTIDQVLATNPVFAIDRPLTGSTIGPDQTASFSATYQPTVDLPVMGLVVISLAGHRNPVLELPISGRVLYRPGIGCSLGGRSSGAAWPLIFACLAPLFLGRARRRAAWLGVALFAACGPSINGNRPRDAAVSDGLAGLDIGIADIGPAPDLTLNLGDLRSIASLDFQAKAVSAGIHTQAVAAGHFDGDGHLDLAVTSPSNNQVSVLSGNGDGTFMPRRILSMSGSPLDLIALDLDGNQAVDLAFSELSGHRVSILLNDGTGKFETRVPFAVGQAPWALRAADFDGDGRPDIATANISSGDVSVLLSKGAGSALFGAATSYPVGMRPISLSTGDLDGDGDIDLAVAVEGDDVMLLINDGNGAMQTWKTLPVTWPESIVATDLNGDAAIDLVVASTDLTLFMNQAGQFTSDVYSVGPLPRALVVGDWNGDGLRDIALANTTTNQISVLRGRGDGSFEPRDIFGVGEQPSGMAAGDFDGDQHLDLAVANSFDTRDGVTLLVNTAP